MRTRDRREIEPYIMPNSHDDYMARRDARDAAERAEVGQAVQAAVTRALAAVDANRVVVINLTVQYASGGGATNIVGDDTRKAGK